MPLLVINFADVLLIHRTIARLKVSNLILPVTHKDIDLDDEADRLLEGHFIKNVCFLEFFARLILTSIMLLGR